MKLLKAGSNINTISLFRKSDHQWSLIILHNMCNEVLVACKATMTPEGNHQLSDAITRQRPPTEQRQKYTSLQMIVSEHWV